MHSNVLIATRIQSLIREDCYLQRFYQQVGEKIKYKNLQYNAENLINAKIDFWGSLRTQKVKNKFPWRDWGKLDVEGGIDQVLQGISRIPTAQLWTGRVGKSILGTLKWEGAETGQSSSLKQQLQIGWTRWLVRGKNKRWRFGSVAQDHQCCHKSPTTPTVVMKTTDVVWVRWPKKFESYQGSSCT